MRDAWKALSAPAGGLSLRAGALASSGRSLAEGGLQGLSGLDLELGHHRLAQLHLVVAALRDGEGRLEGVLLGEDPGGVLVAPVASTPAEMKPGEAVDAPLERGVYLPFHSIETILLLGRRTMRELRRAAVEETVHRERVLDELDRIFFDMVERKGRYSSTARMEDPESPGLGRESAGEHSGHV